MEVLFLVLVLFGIIIFLSLRPSGIALFEGKRLTVIAEGEFIEAQRPIKVVEARGSRVVVKPL